MWHLRKPSRRAIDAFRRQQSILPVAYSWLDGDQVSAPGDCFVDAYRCRLGNGDAVFDAACQALRRWAHFPSGWLEVHPDGDAVEPGRVVVVVAKVCGLWWLNACRIVDVVSDAQRRRFGFTYATLPGHAETGKEQFVVQQDESGEVWYEIDALSRPNYWLARWALPLTRRTQRRFARESLERMQRIAQRAASEFQQGNEASLPVKATSPCGPIM